MSTQQQISPPTEAQSGVGSSESLSEKAQTLYHFLRAQTEQNGGEIYVKGKFISGNVGLSAKQIGQLMLELKGSVSDLEIEKWSYTSATTWRVASL